MLANLLTFYHANQAAIWGVLAGLSELLGLAGKGGVFKLLADFITSHKAE